MARRLNTRLVVYVLIFIGIPAAVLTFAVMMGAFSRGDPQKYFEDAKKYADKNQWTQAWVAVRSAVKAGGAKDPDIQFLLAKVAMKQRPPAVGPALQAYRTVLALKPDHVEAQRDLTELYVRIRYWKEAQAEAERLIRLDPTSGRGYLWAGGVEMSLAEAEPIQAKKVPFYEAAIVRCKAGIEKAPDLMDLYRLMAQAYERLGQPDKVAETLDLAVTNNPTVPEAYILKAQGRLSAAEASKDKRQLYDAKLDEALAILKTGLAKVGENPVLHVALGEVAVRKRNAELAKDYFGKALALDPKNEAGYLRMASLYRMDNDREKALAVLVQGLEQLPDSVNLKVEQADLLLELANFKEAEDLIAALDEATPDSAAVSYLRGKRALLAMHARQAIGYLERAREKQTAPQTCLLLARAYLLADELGAAQRELESLLSDHPGLLSAWRTLAEVQFRLRDPDKASRSAKVVLESNPDDTDMRLLLAQTLVMQRRSTEALKEAQTAAERARDNFEPYLLMAGIYQDMNRLVDAERMYYEALKISNTSPRIYQRFVRFLRETGQKDKLNTFLEQARKRLPEDVFLALAGTPEEVERELKARAEKPDAPVTDILALARLYQLTDRLDLAKDGFRKALAKADPKSNEWHQGWQQLFALEVATEAYDKASELVEQLRKVAPTAVEVLFADALLALSQQDRLAEATEQLRSLTQSYKTLSQAHFLLGQALVRQGKVDEAVVALNRAVELRPQLIQARVRLGLIYLSRGNLNGALTEAAEALKFDQRYVPALEIRALGQAAQGNWDAAAAAREDIARLVPDNVNNLISLAALHVQRHAPEKAEAGFRRAYELAPDNTLLVRGLADFYVDTNRARLGEKVIDDYVSRHKDESRAYLLRGEFTAKASGPAEAEKYFRKAAELSPNDPTPLIFLGDQYGQTGEWEAAAQVYAQAVERDPRSAVANRRLADVYMLQGKLDEATRVIDEVLKANPKDFGALVVAGRIASRRDRPADAGRYFEAALAIEPNYGEAKVRLAELMSGPEPLKALDLLSGIDPADPAFEKAMLLRADINTRRVLLTDAILDLRRLLDFRPTSVHGRLALAARYMAMREPARAADLLQQLSRERLDRDPILLVSLGDAFAFQRRYAEALAQYERARTLKPDSAEALVGEARCLVAMSRTTEAETRIHEVMNVYPKEVWPRMALAAIYEMTGQRDKAKDAIQTGLLARPDWESGYVRLADMLVQDKQSDQARQILAGGLAKLPKSIPIRAGLATLEVGAQRAESARKILQPLAEEFQAQYSRTPEKLDKLRPYMPPIRVYSLTLYNLGQVDEALKWGMMLWTLDPTDVANANNLAWILATAYKDYDRANEMIQQCKRLLPNHPQILDTSGWIAFLSGRYEDAAEDLLASIKYGDNAEAHYHLARVYEARERTEEARAEYQKALALGLLGKDKDEAERRLGRLKPA